MNSSNAPIGIFDSGIGGLTVLHAVQALLPHENFIYLGDTARLPYGTKSKDTVCQYAFRVTEFLSTQHIKLLVVACNTATAAALPELKAKYPQIPIIGVIEAGARAGAEKTRTKSVAILATEGTVRGMAYQNALELLDKNIKVTALPSPLFVTLAEVGWTSGKLVEDIIKEYLKPIISSIETEKIDTIILGCTHFPVLKKSIENVLGKDIHLVDSAELIAEEVSSVLEDAKLKNLNTSQGHVSYFVTDSPERFVAIGKIFTNRTLDENDVTLIDI